jgi:hypothetical protein
MMGHQVYIPVAQAVQDFDPAALKVPAAQSVSVVLSEQSFPAEH